VAGPSIARRKSQPWVSRASRQIAESLFAVLFPSDCRICGIALVKISRLPVCQECLDSIRPLGGELCAICGERLFSSYALSALESEPRCGLCRRIEPNFARAVAHGSYEGGLRELIHLLKYGGVRPAANVLGRMLAEAIAGLEVNSSAEPIAVIPVPLYRARLRDREFNQAETIARAAMKFMPASSGLRLRPGILERKRETASQTGLTRHQRRANVRGAFAVARPEIIKGRQVLVVDDVYTTGATVSECARVLRRAGATKVWVATVARTMKASGQVEIRFSGEADVEEISAAGEFPLARAVGS
jgi:ComF family protein